MTDRKAPRPLAELQREAGAQIERAGHASAIAGIQRGLRGICAGTGEDAEQAFASLETELGISEQP